MSGLVSIREKIESALIKDHRTQDATIDVVNDQGIVTLIGKVESEETSRVAEEVTKSQDGVIKVINTLVVKGRRS